MSEASKATNADASDAADLVARRIVMSREMWDECVKIADEMTISKGFRVLAYDVATLALEAGLKAGLEKVGQTISAKRGLDKLTEGWTK